MRLILFFSIVFNEDSDYDADGDVNMEAGSSSSNVPIPDANERRLSVISICHPLNEDPNIRLHLASDIFCDQPNPNLVPACVKDSTCKSLSINHHFQY